MDGTGVVCEMFQVTYSVLLLLVLPRRLPRLGVIAKLT
jgi:hypothetical protein